VSDHQISNWRLAISNFQGSIVASSMSITGMSSLIGYTGGALEGSPILDESDRRLAVRTGENFEQFRVDGHARTI